jgi:hypothetical protein
MNFYASIIFVLNICLSSSIPIAQLPAKVETKAECHPLDPPFCQGDDVKIQFSGNTTQSSLLLQFKNNPSSFISAMSKADPETLRTVLGLLRGLLDTSNTRETELINILNAKIAELGAAESDVANAEATLNNANNALTAAQSAVASAEADLSAKNQVRATKETEKNDAQDNHDAEIDSLNEEQAMLTQVIEILEELLGRQPQEGNLLASTNDHQYLTVQVSGVMSSSAIAAACESAGYRALCSGPDGCEHNDEHCLVTPESSGCQVPMSGVSHLLCNVHPNSCPEFEGVYNYMKTWNGASGCGVESGSWCSNGANFVDKHALCVV